MHSAGVMLDEMCGRPVMLIPIKDWAYAPVDLAVQEMPHQVGNWVLVFEISTGETWVWDSWILEG
jgi:hypothetical protein